nr:transcription factor MYB1R1-like [Ipomoea batatas]
MLFGVRVMEGAAGPFRKCASMTNLAQFDHHPQESNAGYTSDDVVHPSAGSRERKRGVPWTEEEHRLFLLGLQKVLGATKLEQQSNTLEKLPVAAFPMTAKPVIPPPVIAGESSHNNPTKPTRPIPVLPAPPSSKLADLNLNRITIAAEPLPLSLKLPTPPTPPPSSEQKAPAPGRHTPAFQGISGSFSSSSGDSIISVA